MFNVICLCILPVGAHSTPGSSWFLYPCRTRPAALRLPLDRDNLTLPLFPVTPNHVY